MLSTDWSVLRARHCQGLDLQAEAEGLGLGLALTQSQASMLSTSSAGDGARLQAGRQLPAYRAAQQADFTGRRGCQCLPFPTPG